MPPRSMVFSSRYGAGMLHSEGGSALVNMGYFSFLGWTLVAGASGLPARFSRIAAARLFSPASRSFLVLASAIALVNMVVSLLDVPEDAAPPVGPAERHAVADAVEGHHAVVVDPGVARDLPALLCLDAVLGIGQAAPEVRVDRVEPLHRDLLEPVVLHDVDVVVLRARALLGAGDDVPHVELDVGEGDGFELQGVDKA